MCADIIIIKIQQPYLQHVKWTRQANIVCLIV